MTMTPAVVAVELLVVIGLSIVALLALNDSRNRDLRLRERATGAPGRRRLVALRDGVNASIRRTRWGGRLNLRLLGAGMTLTPLEFVGAVLLVAALAVLICYRQFGILGSVVIVVAVVALANRWIEARRQKRVEAFVGQLPEVARVLSNGASAGLAIRSSVGLAGRELEEPAGSELRTVAEQMDIGHSLPSALAELSGRLPSRELSVLVQTLVIQSRSGGALVTALVNIAATLDQRKELRREIRTATAGATFSGYVVIAIGALAVVVMNLFTPGALDQLAGTLVGRVVLLVSGLLFAGGFLLMRRISRIEV